jgi:hypothetical protein
MIKKPKKHYVDNRRFLEEIIKHKKACVEAEKNGLEKPRLSEYIGTCILMIAERLSTKPKYMNYSFRDEMVSDAIENCFLYFGNFNPEISENPFAYFTQIISFAFHRRINKEEKNRYIIYKSFQESGLDDNLMVDHEDKQLTSTSLYDNINEFIGRFEKKESEKKLKRKQAKEGLEKFMGDEQ